ncbi:MAG: HAMP domain-containing histidine kinase [Candidatus Pristimantibacillus lignocellulolyticus]|uniref:histidine kinase n=1 Tax=Candidatus Pristimantibacillus lignocellulolyticus TaxID=2994561 RepID=A0A9J6ZI04_9BACL|nr:MAG: HAMP domain-containing histidine kinase [Candidatus Pristimantibacillus lignocellulolyticus]
MNKLNKKLISRFSLMFLIIVILSISINTFFLPKYLLYEKKNELATLTTQLETMETQYLIDRIESIENEHDVTIVHTYLIDNIDLLNDTIIDELRKKGITLSKFWITDESVEKLNNHKMVRKIYNQQKLKSSFLVTFMKKDNIIFVIGESISHSTETVTIVNTFNLYIFTGELLLLIILSVLFVRQIVQPLAKIQKAADDISKLSFAKVHIQTGDEIESLAESINEMSDKLEQAHLELESKNKNLRTFIANISHELKTPLSLIKAYTSGIQDGMDDGTYLDVIQKQTDDIAKLVNELLELSKLQIDMYQMSLFDFVALLDGTLKKFELAIKQQDIAMNVHNSSLTNSWVMADQQKIEMVLNNFISNAMKYTTNGQIQITLENNEHQLLFTVSNSITEVDPLQWDNIWEPFFVMESSRSKQLSGTGLGLSIVRTILQKHNSPYGFQVQNGEISFHFSLPTTSQN